MDNSNFWDWDNEDEHRVSSVYRDTDIDAEGVKPQSAEVHNDPIQNNGIQDVIQNTETQNDVIQNVCYEQANAVTPDVVTENNFILVDNPQNTTQNSTPQAEISYTQSEQQQTGYQQTTYQQTESQQTENQQTGYQQTEYQQNNFQQIIPIQNTQQNQGTNKQKEKHNKHTDYSSNFNPRDISENKVSAMAAYLLGPAGIIIALLIARDSAYTAFHVRQALKITICSVVLEIIAAILALFAMIPLVGIIFKLVLIIISVIWLGVLLLRLIAIAQVCDGEAREPAVIGKMNCFH